MGTPSGDRTPVEMLLLRQPAHPSSLSGVALWFRPCATFHSPDKVVGPRKVRNGGTVDGHVHTDVAFD